MKVIVIIPFMFDSYLESDFFKAVVSKYDYTTFVYSGEYNSKYQNSASCRFVSNDEFYPNNRNLVQKIGWRYKVWFIGVIRKISFIGRKDMNSTYKEKNKNINNVFLIFLSNMIGNNVFFKEKILRTFIGIFTKKNSKMRRHLDREKYDHAYVVTTIHDNISVDWLRVLTDCSVDQIIHSWDNLTSKAMFIVAPKKLLVWGRYDKNIAIHQHNISEDIVEIIKPIIISTYIKTQSKNHGLCEYVLFAGVTPALVSNEWHYVECLSQILFHLDKEMKLIYRPHPRVLRSKKLDFTGVECNIKDDFKVINHSKNIFIDAHYQGHIGSMEFLQSKCFCVVTFYSTVSLEFILSRKPAINFNYEVLNHTKINKSVPKYEHNCKLKKESLFVEVSDNAALKEAIKKYALDYSKENKILSSSLDIAPIE